MFSLRSIAVWLHWHQIYSQMWVCGAGVELTLKFAGADGFEGVAKGKSRFCTVLVMLARVEAAVERVDRLVVVLVSPQLHINWRRSSPYRPRRLIEENHRRAFWEGRRQLGEELGMKLGAEGCFEVCSCRNRRRHIKIVRVGLVDAYI